MAAIKYKVELTEAERSRLNEVSQRGKASVRTVKRALSLLKADQGLGDREIADVLLVNAATVARARKRYVEEGLEAASNDRPRPGQERKLDGKQEAHLIAIACSAAPAGHTHWTLQLLADQVVELEFAESSSLETVRQMLKKTNSSRGRSKSGVSPRRSEKALLPRQARGVRGADGGRAGPVPTGVPSGASGSVFRRDLPAIDCGEVRPPMPLKNGSPRCSLGPAGTHFMANLRPSVPNGVATMVRTITSYDAEYQRGTKAFARDCWRTLRRNLLAHELCAEPTGSKAPGVVELSARRPAGRDDVGRSPPLPHHPQRRRPRHCRRPICWTQRPDQHQKGSRFYTLTGHYLCR